MNIGLLNDSQINISQSTIEGFLTSNLTIGTHHESKKSQVNLKEKFPIQIIKSTPFSLLNSTNNNAKYNMYSKNHIISFLVPISEPISKRITNKKQNIEKQAKENNSLLIGRGSTSYKKRNTDLQIENLVLSNTIFNRTHQLLMFGTKESLAEKVSDDEDYTKPPEFLGSRFNPLGNVLDELSYFDNSTNSAIYRCSLNPRGFSPEATKTIIQNRQNFISDMQNFLKSNANISPYEKLNFQIPPEQIRFKPLNYIKFCLSSKIINELTNVSDLMKDGTSVSLLLDKIGLIIQKMIDSRGTPLHFICSEIPLRFIYASFQLFENISIGYLNYPHSLYKFMLDTASSGLTFNEKIILEETQIIADQIAQGGLYCHEFADYKALALAAELNSMDSLVDFEFDDLDKPIEELIKKFDFAFMDNKFYILKFDFQKPLDISITVESKKTNRLKVPVFPLRDMFSKFQQSVEGDKIDQKSQLPW